MTPDQELLLAAAALYLFECFIILPRHLMLFWSPGSCRFRIRPLEHLPGSYTKAFYLAMPLPPLGHYLVAEPWPFALSPDGAASGSVQRIARGVLNEAAASTFVAWSDVRDVSTTGPSIEINHKPFVTCSCNSAAEHHARLIKDLAGTKPARREARILDAIDETLNIARAKESYKTARSGASQSRLIGNALMLLVFIVCPLAVWFRGLEQTWFVLALELALLWAFAVLEFWIAHRRLYKERKRERRLLLLLRGLTPVGAMRFHDALMRDVLATSHPMTIALAICNQAAVKKFAEDVYRDLRFPIVPTDDESSEDAIRARDWFRERMRETTERLFESNNIDPDELLRAPTRDDDASLSFCPRCYLQNTKPTGECPNCAGVGMTAFSA
ncbi:MAG: hypothetical protein H6819_10650 [Phycisphaerales bacterium]|nr:hypothetical protein [Phycisphaerales bacterium]MCB9854394.1 hypothetical protein [Phycisphaerales bacterium]MCB9863595.1 hypothetical protein [Phycisphaerales bacterium]